MSHSHANPWSGPLAHLRDAERFLEAASHPPAPLHGGKYEGFDFVGTFADALEGEDTLEVDAIRHLLDAEQSLSAAVGAPGHHKPHVLAIEQLRCDVRAARVGLRAGRDVFTAARDLQHHAAHLHTTIAVAHQVPVPPRTAWRAPEPDDLAAAGLSGWPVARRVILGVVVVLLPFAPLVCIAS